MPDRPLRFHRILGPWAPLLIVADTAAVVLGAVIAAIAITVWSDTRTVWPLPHIFQRAVAIEALLMVLILHSIGGYKPWRGASLWAELRRIGGAWVAVLLGFAAFAYVTKTGAWFSRLWMVSWFGATLFILIAGRVLLRGLLRELRRKGLDVKNVVIVGGGKLGLRVATTLRANPWTGLSLQGYFAESDGGELVPGCRYMGKSKDVFDYLKSNDVDQVWIALPFHAEAVIQMLLSGLMHGQTVDVRMVPDIFGFRLLNHSIEEIADLPVLNLSASPHQGLDRLLKGLMDHMGAALILILISPLLLLIAIAVRLSSPGPIIFSQLRHGWDGRPIQVYKFRTMYAQAEPPGVFIQAQRNDRRVTPLGRFLRRTSLDELPQFINVLQGRLSLVGPRPHAVQMNLNYMDSVQGYMLRHKVKPGITGWAQVNGLRGETATMDQLEARIEHDLYYIEHWSLWFDVTIILMTVWRGFMGRNAY